MSAKGAMGSLGPNVSSVESVARIGRSIWELMKVTTQYDTVLDSIIPPILNIKYVYTCAFGMLLVHFLAVHAMRQIFEDSNTEAVLLVDATNAFNSINRKAALHNISIICPPLAQILVNTYRAPIRLFITGSGEIASTEGTTQGDPLAMAMYALAITPLIDQLSSRSPDVHQVWYADDTTSASTCRSLRTWWDDLSELGPMVGYNPNGSKTYLVVKEDHEESAVQLFADTDVHVTTNGKRHLGAALGSKTFTEEYVSAKVQDWVKEIQQLAKVALSQPHAAYAAFTHGLSS